MPVQAEALIRLQALDSEIESLTRARANLDSGARLKETLEQLTAGLEENRARLHEHEADQTAAELELQSLESKTSTVRKTLYEGRIVNPKELQALEHEIEMFGRQRSRLDERILLLMEQSEQEGAEVTRLVSELDAAKSEWEQHVTAYKAEGRRITVELQRLAPLRDAKAAEIDASTLKRYDELRRRAANLAVAQIERGSCSGCRTSVPTVIARLAKDAERYAFCENCHRFLFPGPDPDPR